MDSAPFYVINHLLMLLIYLFWGESYFPATLNQDRIFSRIAKGVKGRLTERGKYFIQG